jgi:hypothetical protein
MGMMVAGRTVVETDDEVRCEFGLDRQFDRVLTNGKHTWRVAAEDGRFGRSGVGFRRVSSLPAEGGDHEVPSSAVRMRSQRAGSTVRPRSRPQSQ